REGKLSVIGNGVVVDPWALAKEIETVTAKGVRIAPDNLIVAENCPLILPLHGELDRAREALRGEQKIGTTGRGLGPAYEDKVGRRAIRLSDLADKAVLREKIDILLQHHNALRRGMDLPELQASAVEKELMEIAPKILPYSGVVWKRLEEARREGKLML